MRDFRYMHTYKPFREGAQIAKRPVITTALCLEKDGAGQPVGLAVGFAYCSKTDNPNKKVGRLIALGRMQKVMEQISRLRTSIPREEFESDMEHADAVGSIACFERTRYGQHKTALNQNNEPYQTGHVIYAYIPVCKDDQQLKVAIESVDLPEDTDIRTNIVLALANIQKFGSL
jgi:hypothetical protein